MFQASASGVTDGRLVGKERHRSNEDCREIRKFRCCLFWTFRAESVNWTWNIWHCGNCMNQKCATVRKHPKRRQRRSPFAQPKKFSMDTLRFNWVYLIKSVHLTECKLHFCIFKLVYVYDTVCAVYIKDNSTTGFCHLPFIWFSVNHILMTVGLLIGGDI